MISQEHQQMARPTQQTVDPRMNEVAWSIKVPMIPPSKTVSSEEEMSSLKC